MKSAAREPGGLAGFSDRQYNIVRVDAEQIAAGGN